MLSELCFLGHGCFNSFVIFDLINIDVEFADIKKYAHAVLLYLQRDDALIVEKVAENNKEIVFSMTVLEPNGSVADFCGNGSRVVAKYLMQKFDTQIKELYLQSRLGRHAVYVKENGSIGVAMPQTVFGVQQGGFISSKVVLVNDLQCKLELLGKEYNCYITETLEPHLIVLANISEQELIALGKYCNFQRRDWFFHGINISKCSVLASNKLELVTYERGVNKITSSCGTAATSAASLHNLLGSNSSEILVETPGGTITITYSCGEIIMWGDVYLEG